MEVDLNVPIRIHAAAGSRAKLLTAMLASALTLALSVPALAQDASESPAAAVESASIDFPLMLGGELLATEAYTGSEWLAQFSDADSAFIEGTEALVESVGKTLDDLSVKSALYTPSEGNHAVVAAFRIDGIDAREFTPDAVQLMLGDVPTPELLLRPLGTKWALRVVDAEMPGIYPRTVYVLDDTVWIIEGDEDYVWEALDQLPDPAHVTVSPADTLVSEIPMALDGRRRIGLYEATEPLFLPTFEQHLGPSIEPWLRDLYFDAGISPSEMLGVVAWWGVETVQDGIQIEGYRLPGGASEAVEALRHDIFLGGGPESTTPSPILEGIGQVEQEIGGRTVTTLDYDPARQHVFSSANGDTVWVVTDHVGEADLAEEAIAALP